MTKKLTWFLLALILLINQQYYAFKNSTNVKDNKITTTSATTVDFRRELINKKYNLTDNSNNKITDKLEEFLRNARELNYSGEDGRGFGLEEEEEEDPSTEYEYDFPTNECILARSEFYLSWWVHENGSLRIPTGSRLNSSGIMDLSLHFTSEYSIYTHVLSFTSENPSEVRTIFDKMHLQFP